LGGRQFSRLDHWLDEKLNLEKGKVGLKRKREKNDGKIK
jgi:hypothetical protein